MRWKLILYNLGLLKPEIIQFRHKNPSESKNIQPYN